MGRICFFNTAVAWGGGEKWHLETSSYLHNNGHDVIAVAHKKSVLLQKLKERNIPVIAVEITNLSFANPFKHISLKKKLDEYSIDTIVMNLSRDVKIAGLCAKSIGVNRIMYRRGSAIPIKNTFLNRYYFGQILTEILANSVATKKTILQNNPNLFPEEKIRVIYNGIDIPKNLPELTIGDEVKDKPFTLINLGRLEAQKNQSFLIQLAAELKNREVPFKLIIGGDGRLKDALQNEISKLGVEDVVELAGFIDDPIAFMARGDVFVLPSLWEGFGYVLAEAAVCKKPIVAFDLSSNPELVVDGKTGFLVAPNQIDPFADALENLRQNPKLAKEMGEEGFEHVRTNFDKKENLKKIAAYLING